MNRKICAFLMVVCLLMVSVSALAEQQTPVYPDATYYYLYTQLLNCVDNKNPDDNMQLLHISNASIWKKSETNAGFMFEGDDWEIIGDCDMETGLINRVLCKIPYSEGGLLTIYGITFCLSGEMNTQDFFDKYVPDDAVLRNLPFPEYSITLNGGADKTFVFEYTRNASLLLHNDSNKCPMKELIASMQQ